MELLPELGQELISPREPRIIYVSVLWGFFICSLIQGASDVRRDKNRPFIFVGRASLITRDIQLAGTTKPQRGDRYIENG